MATPTRLSSYADRLRRTSQAGFSEHMLPWEGAYRNASGSVGELLYDDSISESQRVGRC